MCRDQENGPNDVDVLNPFGEIVAIDDPSGIQVGALKSKSLSFHWELMFTRALAGGDAQLSQHRLLERVAELVDAGRIRSTATTIRHPINAQTSASHTRRSCRRPTTKRSSAAPSASARRTTASTTAPPTWRAS